MLGQYVSTGVEGIVLLFSANDGSGPVYKFPAYDYFAPVLEPLLEEVRDLLQLSTAAIALSSSHHSRHHMHVTMHAQGVASGGAAVFACMVPVQECCAAKNFLNPGLVLCPADIVSSYMPCFGAWNVCRCADSRQEGHAAHYPPSTGANEARCE